MTIKKIEKEKLEHAINYLANQLKVHFELIKKYDGITFRLRRCCNIISSLVDDLLENHGDYDSCKIITSVEQIEMQLESLMYFEGEQSFVRTWVETILSIVEEFRKKVGLSEGD